jgi:pyruvate carboxylase
MADIMREGPVNPVKIQDNTFRDGHQSIYATRMRTKDMLPIAEQMDEMDFWAMEVWGNAFGSASAVGRPSRSGMFYGNFDLSRGRQR